jgi:protocatechuate 3,4-dioxygenase beta subunit
VSWLRVASWVLVPVAAAAAQAPPGGGAKKVGETGEVGTMRITAQFVDAGQRPLAGVGMLFGEDTTLFTTRALERGIIRSDAQGRIDVQVPAIESVGPYVSVQRFALFAKPGYSTVRVSVPSVQYYYTPWGGRQRAGSTDRDLGQITMLPAGALSGVVRGGDGRPLAGAVVTATDLLSSGFYLRFHNRYGAANPQFLSRAETDAKGRFTLTGAFTDGMALAVEAPGHYDHSEPFVSADLAIDIGLESSGFIAGAVVDGEGKPVEAYLHISAEGQGYASGFVVSPTPTAKDGSFRVSLSHRGRYVVRATGVVKPGEAYRSVTSPVFAGPREGIKLEMAAAEVGKPPIKIKIVAKDTGAVVASARASVIWQDPRYINTMMLESTFEHNARPVKNGVAELPAPLGSQPPQGALLVKAEGFSPALLKDLEYDEEKPLEVEVRLANEALIEGVALDETTGKPLAGAEVTVTRAGANRPNPYMGGYQSSPGITATTDAVGRFRVGSLPVGRLELTVRHRGRPDSKVMRLELGESEQRRGVEVRMPVGVVLSGRVFMGRDGAGQPKPVALTGGAWRVRLGAWNSMNQNTIYSGFGFFEGFGMPSSGPDEQADSCLLDPAGRFRLAGLGAGRYRFFLIAPPIGKRGRELQTSIEPLRIRTADIERDFDIAGDLGGVVRGKVVFTGASLPMSRLFLLSMPGSSTTVAARRAMFNPSYFRCVVEPDGTFAFRAPQGRQEFWIMDAVGATVLYRGASSVEVEAGGTNAVTLEVPLALVRLRLRPDDPKRGFCVSTIEWMVTHPGEPDNPNFARYPQGFGVPAQGTRELLLHLPPVRCEVIVRSALSSVDQQGGHGNEALGGGEIVPQLGRLNTLEIKIEPPAEVSEPAEDKAKRAAAGAKAAIAVEPAKDR